MPPLKNECWAITDAAAGNQRQALALAEMMGLPVRHLLLEPRDPQRLLERLRERASPPAR